MQKWSEAQNAHARSVLDKLPGVDAAPREAHEDHGREDHEPLLARRPRRARSSPCAGSRRRSSRSSSSCPPPDKPDDARVLLDPNELDKKGTTSIDWFVPSPDGKLVAVSLSKDGSEAGDVHVFDVGDRQADDEVIPRVNNGTAGGDLAWAAGRQGLLLHPLPARQGTPRRGHGLLPAALLPRARHPDGEGPLRARQGLAADRRDQGRGARRRPAGCSAPCRTATAASSPTSCAPTDGKWKQFADFKDGVVQAAFGPNGRHLSSCRARTPPRGKILRLAAADPDLAKATVVVPEGTDTIVTDF